MTHKDKFFPQKQIRISSTGLFFKSNEIDRKLE